MLDLLGVLKLAILSNSYFSIAQYLNCYLACKVREYNLVSQNPKM